MAFTQDQLTKLEQAIALGALKVRYSDKEVVYQSLNDMCAIRDMMRRELGIVTSADGARVAMGFSKGLE